MSHSVSDTPLIYKICSAAAWKAAEAAGQYEGSADDRRDGYIHFSALHQVGATAAKYFRGQADLVLVAVDPGLLGAGLKWEPSRGGDLFPHLYGPLPASAARLVVPLALDDGGVPIIPGQAG